MRLEGDVLQVLQLGVQVALLYALPRHIVCQPLGRCREHAVRDLRSGHAARDLCEIIGDSSKC